MAWNIVRYADLTNKFDDIFSRLDTIHYRCLHGLGPDYFSEDFRLVSEIHSRQRLCSAVFRRGSYHTPVLTWRPRISGRRITGMEHVTAQCHLRAIPVFTPATSEDVCVPATTAPITLISVSWSWNACTQHHVNPGELNWTEHQRDRQTDGRTDTGWQQWPRWRIASRGKIEREANGDVFVWVETCCIDLPFRHQQHRQRCLRRGDVW